MEKVKKTEKLFEEIKSFLRKIFIRKRHFPGTFRDSL